MADILQRIAGIRRQRIEEEGHALGVPVSASRTVPVVPFGREPFVICEIKRKSPSRGEIAASLDPVDQAQMYVSAGVRSISVLTEEDHFGGSLSDLIRVKNAFPDVAVLRKDFLFDVEDIDLSYRAGADAVLLIAALLSPGRLELLYRRALSLGITALVEVHTAAEVDAVRSAGPDLVGVNSRDLNTFRVDRLLPLRLRGLIDWSCRTVFESGIFDGDDVSLAAHGGYDGVLVGEAVVRRPEAVAEILTARRSPGTTGSFWARLFGSRRDPAAGPLVKICGLTSVEDVEAADRLGADMIGFIFAESPRRVDVEVVRALPRTHALKVGVVVLDENGDNLQPEIRGLVEEGKLDALQLHGQETPDACSALRLPSYKALRLRSAEDAAAISRYRSPRVLVDAFSTRAQGGTGRMLDAEVVQAAAQAGPLWMAGGLGPDNVRRIIETHAPELIDASSRLEAEPGRKDHLLLEQFFTEIRAARGYTKG